MATTPVRRMLRSPLPLVVTLAALWFIAAFLVMPNVSLLTSTFFPDGQFSGRALEKLLSSDRAMRSLFNSLLLAVTLTITVNVVGVFIVLVTQYFKVRGSRILWLGYATTLIYGGIVLAAGYNFIYGRYGFVTNVLAGWFPELDRDWFSGYLAVVFVMTFATTTNHMLFLSNALGRVDYQTIEAARLMGASDIGILRKIVLPVLRPMIFAVSVLTFLTGLGALTAPLVLGGQGFQTIAPMILTFSKSASSRDLAALLAIILGLATIALLTVLNRVERSGVYFSVAKVATPLQRQQITNPVTNAFVQVAAWVLFVIYASPVAMIVIFSFLQSSAVLSGSIAWADFTLENYARVFSDPATLRPLLVSLSYAAVASIVVVVGILFVARLIQQHRNWMTTTLEYLLHIPWILPTILIALGLIMAFDRPRALIGGQVLTGTVVILGLAYVIIKIPFTLRLLKAAFSAIPSSLEEAAQILGAKAFTRFRHVIVPLVLPTAAAISALNFNSLLDDYDAAVFLYHPLYTPLGIAIKQSTEGENNLSSMSVTFVYTVLLMVVQGLTVYLVYGRGSRLGSGRKAKGARRRGATPSDAVVSTESAAPVAPGVPR